MPLDLTNAARLRSVHTPSLSELFLRAGSGSDGYNSSNQNRAALAAATGGGASDCGGASALGRPGKQGGAYQDRSGVLKLEVALVCRGACGYGDDFSSE